MSARLTRVVIFDERLYAPGHLVHRWMSGLVRTFGNHARFEAPIRSGQLKAGIRTGTHRTGKRTVEGYIESSAPHSLYVIKGTAFQGRRYIYSRIGWLHKAEIDAIVARRATGPGKDHSGWYMILPPPGRRFHLRVHGQRKNDFLTRAWIKTGRRHSSIRGVRSPF